jgi:asparagine synthase (glutamine-hydrolysing)
MAHGLEVRVPYLDKTVVEFGERLGAGMKVRNGQRKWIHRKVARRYLPQSILARKKRGFAVNVVDDWFHSALDSVLSELLLDSDSLMFNVLRVEPVRQLLEAHRSGREDNHKLLFSLAMFEQWLRGQAAARPQPLQPQAVPATCPD